MYKTYDDYNNASDYPPNAQYGEYIDLTHPLTLHTVTYNPDTHFILNTQLDYHQCTSAVPFKVQHMKLPCGLGTHIDAPAHCIPHGRSVDQIPLNNLITSYTTVNVSYKSHETYIISYDDVAEFKGSLKNNVVIFHTGWSKTYAEDPKKYRNNYQYPTLSKEAALFLVEEKIAGIGIDTLAPDTAAQGFIIHDILLSNDIYIIENLANTHLLPHTGKRIIVAPLPIVQGTEAPARVYASTD